jgi:4-hydroxybenzoate polyprenyltransferase
MSKILFYYSAIMAFFVSISLVATSESLPPVFFAIFFLPVTAYFVLEFSKHLRGKGDFSVKVLRGEIIALIVIFLVLCGLAIKNIYSGKATGQPGAEIAKPSSSPLIFRKGTSK